MARAKATYSLEAVDRSQGAFRSFRANAGAAAKAVGGLAAAGGALAAGGLATLVKSSLDAGDEIQKLAIQTGATTEFLSEMQHVAGLSGAEFERLPKAIKTMSVALDDAAQGGKRANESLERLGLTSAELAGLSVEQRLLTLGEALRQVSDDGERAALAQVFFGGAAKDVLRITQTGSAAIADMRAEAQKLGLSLSRDQVDQMANANDALARLGAAVQGVGNMFAVQFAEPIAQAATTLGGVLVPVLQTVGGVFGTLGRTIGGTGAALAAFFSGDFREAGRIFTMNVSDLIDDLTGAAAGVTGAGAALREAAPASSGGGAPRLEDQILTGGFGPTGKALVDAPQLNETNGLLRELVRKQPVAVAG